MTASICICANAVTTGCGKLHPHCVGAEPHNHSMACNCNTCSYVTMGEVRVCRPATDVEIAAARLRGLVI